MKLTEKTWFIGLMLVIFFPVGLFLMWKNSNWNKVVKIIITAVLVLAMFGAVSDDEGATEVETLSVPKTEATTKVKNEEEKSKPVEVEKTYE